MTLKEWWMPEVQQEAFRAVLDGFARPGSEVAIGRPDAGSAVMLLAALLDESMTLADPGQLLSADQRRLLLAPEAPAGQALFVLFDGAVPPGPEYTPSLGTLESPELGATLLLNVSALSASPQPGSLLLQLRGPGIAHERVLCVSGLHPEWLTRRAGWVGAYPLGLDVVLCAPDRLVAIPRTIRIDLQYPH